MNKTGIEYLDYSWNVTHGCSPVSPGCKNCWAKTMSRRLAGMGVRGYSKADPFAVTCCQWKLDEPLKVKKPSMIGVSFMGDLFHEKVRGMFLDSVISTICEAPQHTFQILTKRVERMKRYFEHIYFTDTGSNDIVGLEEVPIPNVWLGVSVSTQEEAERKGRILIDIGAAVRFLSIEPILEEIDVWPLLARTKRDTAGQDIKFPGIDWVIVGAESGPNRRSCNIEWVQRVKDDCVEAGVPIFIKQVHDYIRRVVHMPEIDGQVWNQMPEAKP